MDQLFKHQPNDVFNKLTHWAEQLEPVRAMLLTSTRAVPNASVDTFSDYDVILIVEDIHPFYEDRRWLENFGEVLVVYWDAIYSDPDHGDEKFGNVTQYADGLKIDFTLLPVRWLKKVIEAPVLPAELDAGYRILLDKDRLTMGMKSPTYAAYVPTRPSNEEYQKIVNDFFSDVPYMAKCLLRGELLPAKWCLDYDMKHVHLRPMLEWRMGLEHNWSVPTGSLGKGLKKRLPPGSGLNWKTVTQVQIRRKIGRRYFARSPSSVRLPLKWVKDWVMSTLSSSISASRPSRRECKR